MAAGIPTVAAAVKERESGEKRPVALVFNDLGGDSDNGMDVDGVIVPGFVGDPFMRSDIRAIASSRLS